MPGAPPPNFTVRVPVNLATVTITDDDPQPLMSIADITVVEGDTAELTVSIANASHMCAANFTTVDGSATDADGDFTPNAGMVNFTGLPRSRSTSTPPTIRTSRVRRRSTCNCHRRAATSAAISATRPPP